MTIEKPTYVKAGDLLMLLYATILNHAQYSYYYKKLFCPKDAVIVEKKHCMPDKDDAASLIQSQVLEKLNSDKPIDNKSKPTGINNFISKIWIL